MLGIFSSFPQRKFFFIYQTTLKQYIPVSLFTKRTQSKWFPAGQMTLICQFLLGPVSYNLSLTTSCSDSCIKGWYGIEASRFYDSCETILWKSSGFVNERRKLRNLLVLKRDVPIASGNNITCKSGYTIGNVCRFLELPMNILKRETTSLKILHIMTQTY